MKKCPHCGKDFEESHAHQVYCSKMCKQDFNSLKRRSDNHKTCPVCGAAFESPWRKYCSDACSYKVKLEMTAESNRMKQETDLKSLVKCGWCGEYFKPKRNNHVFCSDYCNGAYHRSQRQTADLKDVPCVICGKVFRQKQVNSKYCSDECKREGNRRTSKAYRKYHPHPQPLSLKGEGGREEEGRKGRGCEMDGWGQELPDALFERCECGREFVRSEKAGGRCPICRGVYNVRREIYHDGLWKS